jgi:tRNA(Ile)-lysidine synthase
VLAEFKEHIKQHFPELTKKRFLLACSGGIDSMVLTHLCNQSEMDFALAHCNFKLRGNESDEDERFVRAFAKKSNKSFFIQNFDTLTYVETHKVSVQMAARELRYLWFEEIMKENGISILVTAHHADDDLETFIINLSRGTGIKGLTGIPSRTKSILRPLLFFPRKRISAFAKLKNIEWREEESNKETKYLRNKIRHQIVPLLKELHPTFLDNFKATLGHLKQIEALTDNHIDQLRQRLFSTEGGITRISIESLLALEHLDAYLYGLFNAYGFTEWQDVLQLLTALSGKEVRSKTHRLIKDREELLLVGIAPKVSKIHEIGESDTEVLTPIQLRIGMVERMEERDAKVLYVDKETLKYPLTLRKWQKGDYFYPMGMRGRKKLSKYFKDEKVNVLAKGEQWLLCSGDDIVWVVGRRADERFKISDKTKGILKITMNS